MIDESPYLKLLGTTTELLDAGHYRCRIELDRKHTNMFGGINGGVNAGLLDSVTYWCLLCCMPEDVGYIHHRPYGKRHALRPQRNHLCRG